MSDTEPPGSPRADPSADPVDTELGHQLRRVENEKTPEHLLKLARELQGLLRDKT